MEVFRFYLFLISLFVSIGAFAQKDSNSPSKAETYFANNGFSATVSELTKDGTSQIASSSNQIQLLADSYRMIGDSYNAEYWYSLLVSSGNSSNENILHYAQALQSNGKYDEAKLWGLMAPEL